jgi:GNAT superfamily N-acetyltransferase
MAWQALLDNVIWHSLHGSQAHLSVGTALARRYARGYSPIAGFADAARPDFSALEAFCELGELLYCSGPLEQAPAGWRVDAETTLMKMVWAAPMPAADPGFAPVRLGPEHVPQMMDLVAVTKPGPFGPRTLEMGDYFGVFEGERLIAMAGERMFAAPLREISGVCTHPQFQGRGLARRLMNGLIRREMQRGEAPFLHVMCGNVGAIALYRSMGFEARLQMPIRVMSRTA